MSSFGAFIKSAALLGGFLLIATATSPKKRRR